MDEKEIDRMIENEIDYAIEMKHHSYCRDCHHEHMHGGCIYFECGCKSAA